MLQSSFWGSAHVSSQVLIPPPGNLSPNVMTVPPQGGHHTMVALELKEFQYNLKKTFLRWLWRLVLPMMVTCWGGGGGCKGGGTTGAPEAFGGATSARRGLGTRGANPGVHAARRLCSSTPRGPRTQRATAGAPEAPARQLSPEAQPTRNAPCARTIHGVGVRTWWMAGTPRGGAGHLGLTHTETQPRRLWTA